MLGSIALSGCSKSSPAEETIRQHNKIAQSWADKVSPWLREVYANQTASFITTSPVYLGGNMNQKTTDFTLKPGQGFVLMDHHSRTEITLKEISATVLTFTYRNEFDGSSFGDHTITHDMGTFTIPRPSH